METQNSSCFRCLCLPTVWGTCFVHWASAERPAAGLKGQFTQNSQAAQMFPIFSIEVASMSPHPATHALCVDPVMLHNPSCSFPHFCQRLTRHQLVIRLTPDVYDNALVYLEPNRFTLQLCDESPNQTLTVDSSFHRSCHRLSVKMKSVIEDFVIGLELADI